MEVVDRRLFVVLGSSLTALAIARNAHKLGLDAVVLDTHKDIAGYSKLAKFEHLENSNQKTLKKLIALGNNGTNYLIATSDYWLNFISRYRKSLEGNYKLVIHPNNKILSICLDKNKFSLWCKKNALSIPEQYNYKKLDSVEFPIVIRPSRTRHSLVSKIPKAVQAKNKFELESWLEVYSKEGIVPVISESLVSDDILQYSVCFASCCGNLRLFTAIKRRPLPQNFAVGTYVELAKNRSVEKFARKIIDSLEYFGIGEIEILHSKKSGKNYVIEINARPWIQYSLATCSGHDFLQLLIEPSHYSPDYEIKEGKGWLNLFGDIYVCFSRDIGLVRKGQVSYSEYFSSLAKANVYSEFSLTDMGPFLHTFKEFVFKLICK